MLSPQTTAAVTWPIPGDIPDIDTIIDDQSATIAAQAQMLADYQGVLNAAQNPPSGTPATGNVTTSGSSTTISVNVTAGGIVQNALVGGDLAVPGGTTVLGQISGTPSGTGSYLVSHPLNYATATALTFTPPPPASTWPPPTDAHTLMLVQQMQATVLRIQSALLQAYQDLLNTSQTPAPATGP